MTSGSSRSSSAVVATTNNQSQISGSNTSTASNNNSSNSSSNSLLPNSSNSQINLPSPSPSPSLSPLNNNQQLSSSPSNSIIGNSAAFVSRANIKQSDASLNMSANSNLPQIESTLMATLLMDSNNSHSATDYESNFLMQHQHASLLNSNIVENFSVEDTISMASIFPNTNDFTNGIFSFFHLFIRILFHDLL
jgi:hypothetical protein